MCSQADLIFFFFVFVVSIFIMPCTGVVVLGIYPARGSRGFLKRADVCRRARGAVPLCTVFSPFGTPDTQMAGCQLCVTCVFSALSTSFFSLRVRMFHTELPSLEFINPFVFSNLLLIHWIIRFSYFSVLVNFLTDVILRRRSPPGPLYFPPSPLFSWACSWWLLCGLPGASSVWHLGVCFCCFFFSFSVRCA